jgi:hypothetical protein
MNSELALTLGTIGGASKGSAGRGALLRTAVDNIFQFLAGLEKGDFFGRNFDPIAGLGIASNTGFALSRPEAAKATNLNLIARAQGAHYTVEDGLNYHLAILARKFRKARDFFD